MGSRLDARVVSNLLAVLGAQKRGSAPVWFVRHPIPFFDAPHLFGGAGRFLRCIPLHAGGSTSMIGLSGPTISRNSIIGSLAWYMASGMGSTGKSSP